MTANKRNLKVLLEHIHTNPEYKEKKSRLLYFLNLGRVHHIHRQYHASNLALNQAKSLMQELYTQSLSKKAQTLILNDQYDIYYGERYDHSLVHFYLSLNSFLLWQEGKIRPWYDWKDGNVERVDGRVLSQQERRAALMSARASLLDWDSFLKEWKVENGRDDLLAKTYGGLVHENVGTRNDLQIALQLYKDALKVFDKQYKNYKSFREDTQAKEITESFLKAKIIALTKRIRPHRLKRELKVLKLDHKKLKKIQPVKNVTFLLQSSQIPAKMAETHYYSLAKAINRPGVAGAIAQIGAVALTLFASKQLGLLPPPKEYNPPAVHNHLVAAHISITETAISFELPEISPSQPSSYTLAILSPERELFRKNIPLIQPLGDVATEALAKTAPARYTRVGLRLAGKYAALIASTYALFKKHDNPLARQAALLSFMAGSHLIRKSERADLRHWNTLPQDIRLLNFHLPAGDYTWKLYKNSQEHPLSQGRLSVKDGHKLVNIQELSPDTP